MTHNDTCKLVHSYLDEELSADEIDEFEAHLQTCDACGESVSQTRQLDIQIARAWRFTVKAPAGLSAKVSTNRTTATFSRRGKTLQWGAAISLLLAAFATAWMLINGSNIDTQSANSSSPAPQLVDGGVQPPVQIRFKNSTIHAPPTSNERGFTLIKVYPGVRIIKDNQGVSQDE